MHKIPSYQSRFIQCDPENHVFRVNRDAYRSPEVFEEEKHKILYKTWIVLGHESEVANPGDYVTRRIIDKELIFNRDHQGRINVFYNSCMHRGPAVCKQKSGNRKSYTCPYHGWVFRNDGQLVSTGAAEKDGSYPPYYIVPGERGVTLMRVKNVAQRGGFYFVNFDDNAMPLNDYLQDAGLRLDRIASQTVAGFEIVAGMHEYEINANYKLLCENSYDGYHLFQTHTTYIDYVAEVLKGTEIDPGLKGIALTLGNGHAAFETPTRAGRPIAQWLPHWGEEIRLLLEEKRREVIGRLGEEAGNNVCDMQSNMVIFPNSIINDQQSVLARTIIPLAHNRMRVMAWTIAPRDEHPKLRDLRLENMLSFLGPGGFATPDDVSMLEWAQTAYESTNVEWNDFSKGMSVDEETMHTVAKFDNELQMRAYWLQWDRMMSAK